ncbi:hypothetical protein C4J81_16565 [Deltaproteobacteria bacterium Smac51]|nr:hypothetical protein C4J81_16565 [Deltaproteobacteria bacterium Smac51]
MMAGCEKLMVDLFAGGGGASLGMDMALRRPVDIAINHNPESVAIHAANHPGTRHYVQNIYQVHPLDATGGRPVGVLWASPDCTHFSKAKGDVPKCRGRRELAWTVVNWIRYTRPELVGIENVEEFLTWGPLDGEGRPIKAQAGETFRRWIAAIRREGYSVDWRILKACDYGAPTIRRRLFIVARRDRKPVKWPEPTHGPGRERPWRTAAECIDWSIPVPSIFERKKPLVENTLKRIAEGLRRFVIETDQPFIVNPDRASWLLQANTGVIGRPADWPLSTICLTGSHQQLAEARLMSFIQHVQHGGRGRAGVMPADEPLRTITANPKGGGMALVAANLIHYYGTRLGERPRCGALDEPFRTATAVGNRFGLMSACLTKVNHTPSNSFNFRGQSLSLPLPTITQKHGFGLAVAYLSHFYGTMQDGRLELPMKTVTSCGLHSGLAAAFLTKYYGTGWAETLALPMSTATRRLKLGLTTAFLTKYYGNGTCHSLDEPLGTLTTKERYGLVTVSHVPLVWIEGEPYVIADIGLRMLTPRELARAQGYPDGYKFDPVVNGKPLSQKSQVGSIGNSVPPDLARAVIGENSDALDAPEEIRPQADHPLLVSLEEAAA